MIYNAGLFWMEVSLACLDAVGKTHTTPRFPLSPLSADFAHEKSVKSLIGIYRRFFIYAGLFLYISRFVAAYPQILCLEFPREGQDPPDSCSRRIKKTLI